MRLHLFHAPNGFVVPARELARLVAQERVDFLLKATGHKHFLGDPEVEAFRFESVGNVRKQRAEGEDVGLRCYEVILAVVRAEQFWGDETRRAALADASALEMWRFFA